MRAAKLAAAADALKRKSETTAPFNLAFMTDRKRVPDPALIARVLPKGSAVILRDYDMPKRGGLAAQLAQICKTRGLLLFVGADPALALRVGAKGLHLPSWFRMRNEVTSSVLKNLIVTASCHSGAELRAAKAKHASVAFLSPAFATPSHPGASALGSEQFRRIASASPLPVIALGGVNESNASTLAARNVAGIAAIGTFTG